MNINDWRTKIDALDDEILKLLDLRAQYAIEVGRLKRAADKPLYDAQREAEITARLSRREIAVLDAPAIKRLFRRIISETRRAEALCVAVESQSSVKPVSVRFRSDFTLVTSDKSVLPLPRVLYQGVAGAFSEQAACELFNNHCIAVSCATLENMFAPFISRHLNRQSNDDAINQLPTRLAADYILLPIENSSAGAVPGACALLRASRLPVVAEITLPVMQNLIACHNARLEDIETVESHPVALAQCSRFFNRHPHLVARSGDDTAGSVRCVIASGDSRRAAIASRRAAEIYGAQVLMENIADRPDNTTRFLLLAVGCEPIQS